MAAWSLLIDPIAGFFKQRSKRKQAKETALAKLKQSKSDNNYQLQLTDQEWEAIGKAAESDSWKDEYVTVVVTGPLVAIFICAMLTVLLADPTYMQAAQAGVDQIKALMPNYETIVEVVVYAAVSIKGIGKIIK